MAPGPGSVALVRESGARHWAHEAQEEPATGAVSTRAAPSRWRPLTSAEPGSALLNAVAAFVQESLVGA